MRLVSRSLLVCVLGFVFGGFSQVVPAVAAEPLGEETSQGGSLLGAPLVVSSADRLFLGGEESQAAKDATHSNPEAVRAREASTTSFEDLTPGQTASEAKAAFPDLIEQPAGAPPRLPVGQRIVSYETDNAAKVSLPDGVGVIESLEPIAATTPHGGHAPLDLRLEETGGHFQPVLSDVGVDVPKDLSNGVSLSGTGVSLTPVDGSGFPLAASAGALDGSAVVWGDAEDGAAGVHDLATLAKPSPEGFDLTSMLLSQRSPGKLYFRVGMPAGAHLESSDGGSVRVIKDGVTLATVSPVSARDAEGTEVPVSMDIHGDVLALTVDLSGDYLYPIAVDPEINDSQLAETTTGKRSNWIFETNAPSKFKESAVYEGAGKEHLETEGIAEYKPGELAFWRYRTKGVSNIYGITTETSAKNKNAKIESVLEFEDAGSKEETKKVLSNEGFEPEYEKKKSSLCAANGAKKEETVCLPSYGTAGNSVHFQQYPSASPGSNYKFKDTMSQATVSLSEPTGTHSTTSYNTSASEVEVEVEKESKKEKVKRVNVLHGSGNWLTQFKGAFETVAQDTGIGVAVTKLEYESSVGKWEQIAEHNYLEKENACRGVQCYETHSENWALPKLPDGEDGIRYKAEEAISGTQSLETEGKATVKVDTAPPRAIELKGLPYGNELSEKHYELTAEATDGTGTTISSSGMKSITLFLDGKSIKDKEATEIEEGKGGKEAGKKEGECSTPKGECTATEKWILNGAELGAGHHSIQIVGTDNAGNEGRLPGGGTQISIRHSTPVALGPGSVDLESGDFALGATDVSMGSGLTIGRNYSSRATTAGGNGPLGPEWNLSLGSTESLTEMVDGSVLLIAGDGSQTIFAALGEGKFESPTGDSNLELSLEENKTTKQKLAYYLKNAAAHTSVKFKQPTGTTTGTKNWVPVTQEGTAATDTVTYFYDPLPAVSQYPVPGAGEGTSLEGITAGPDGNAWFVEHLGDKVGKITPVGAVSTYSLPSGAQPNDIISGPDGNLWFTESKKIGTITPSGKITQYKTDYPEAGATGIATGADGRLWYTEPSNNSIDVISTSGVAGSGAYLPAGSSPTELALGPDGNIWFVDGNFSTLHKIGKVTTSGVVTEYALPAGSKPVDITAGPGNSMWFTNAGTKKIGKITMAGEVSEYSLPAGGGTPNHIVEGPDKNVWFTDQSRVGKVTAAGEVSEYDLGSGQAIDIAPGSDGNLWFTGTWIFGGSTQHVGSITPPGATAEPAEVRAPVPAGVTCAWAEETEKWTEMNPGCRDLQFEYSGGLTAKGEAQSEWGSFPGRLARIVLVAYNPSAKKMEETVVARYEYDQLGRLRAEYDPRISPNLKTTYGYDEEGHVTALSPPGQEPWTFTYGAIAGDAGTGRLLKAARAPASTELWKGEALASTEAPKITGAVREGVKLAVSSGKWSGNPNTYGYQWKRCTAAGACSPIPGATNANYTPQAADVGDTLIATVQATSADGSLAASAETATVQTLASGLSTSLLPAGSGPMGITPGPEAGTLWFTDFTSSRIGKSTSSGTITEYTPLPAASGPLSIVQGPDGNLWFTNNTSSKIGKITTLGTITEYGLPANSRPRSIVAGSDGNLWFTEAGTTSKIGKITTSGTVTEYALPSGSAPFGITSGPEGNLWFTLPGTQKIGKITTSGTITEYPVSGSSASLRITTGPDGNLWFVEGSVIAKITTSGTVTEYPLPVSGEYITSASGALWVTGKGSSTIYRVATSGTISEYPLPSGSQDQQLAVNSLGEFWLAELNDKLAKFTSTNLAPGETVAPEPGMTLAYGVPLSGEGSPRNMTEKQTAKWGQVDNPVEATAIFPADEPQGWPVSGYKRANVYYLDEQGRQVNVISPCSVVFGSVSTTEYNEFNDVIRTLSPENRRLALASEHTAETSKLLDTQSTYNGEGAKEGEVEEPGTRLIETFGPEHEIKYTPNGFTEQKESLARPHTTFHYDEGAPGGEKYDLVTEKSELAQLFNSEGKSEEEVEVRKSKTSYSGQEGLGWKLRAPTSVTDSTETGGLKVTHTTLYNETTAQITETRGPAGSGGESAHDARTIYYSAGANTEGFSACGSHPEWAGLVCETLPAKQPEGGPAPKLPVTTATYNMLNEPLTVTETFGSTVRTKTETYDGSGRLTSSEMTSTANTALPKVTNEYNSTTGVLEKQSTTVEGATKTVTSKYNALGQRTEYTDADGNTAKYKYGTPANDGLLEEITDGSSAGAGKQTYSYNATTKLMEGLTDSSAGTFTASYDVEGHMTSEVYPNGMCANTAYNSVGEATHIEYLKTSNCLEGGAGSWYSEARSPSVRGETFSRASTLASENYTYDRIGRLTESQETPAGEGCTTRLYAYDEESNRTSQTTRSPGGGGKCATEGGTAQAHTYDEGNRLTDTGIAYDGFGNVTKLPAADAEGHELTSTFYVDGAVATQSQNGVSNSYYLDPEGRVRETISGAKTTIAHYDGPGETVEWTSEGEGKSKRNIPGIGGALDVTQTNSETPVIQLHDLQGDVVATIGDKAGETKLLSTYNSTEFGVPNAGKAPPAFAWLGAAGIASSLPSGVITYGATSYVPQTGRALQSEQVEPPGLSGGSGAGAAYTMQEEPWDMQGAARAGTEAPGLEAARERAAMEAALRHVDPEKQLSRAAARERGEILLLAQSLTEVISFIDIPEKVIEAAGSVFGASLGLNDALKWFHDSGEKLIKCANNKRQFWGHGYNICRWTFEEDELGPLKWPDFSVEPEVEECTNYSLLPSLPGHPAAAFHCDYMVYILHPQLA